MLKTLVMDYTSRLHHVRASFRRKGIDGFLVTGLDNIRYLSGFTGSSAFLLITRKENFFFTDFRYKEQSEKEVSGWEIIIEKGNRIKVIRDVAGKTGIKKLGFESSVTYEFFKKLSDSGLSLKAFEGLIEKLREMKDALEIDLIREAVRRAESAFLEVRPYIRKGMREGAITLRLEERLRKNGCRQIPFDTIVASGPNSAMPHAKPTDRKLSAGDLVVIDWGGEAAGYFSDMTRTLLVKGGHEIDKKREIYNIVLEAGKKAISSITPGIRSKEIDAAARNFIKAAEYGDFFGHGTGHGVGIQVHEAPRITWAKSVVVKENMVFTIEPGIYVPGLGGVRIEDMVAVGPVSPEVLTGLPKELEILR